MVASFLIWTNTEWSIGCLWHCLPEFWWSSSPQVIGFQILLVDSICKFQTSWIFICHVQFHNDTCCGFGTLIMLNHIKAWDFGNHSNESFYFCIVVALLVGFGSHYLWFNALLWKFKFHLYMIDSNFVVSVLTSRSTYLVVYLYINPHLLCNDSFLIVLDW